MSTVAFDFRNERQQISFTDLIDLWSVAIPVTTATGAPGNEVLTLEYTDVPSRVVYTRNVDDLSGIAGRQKRKTIFTIDGYQMCADQQCENGWFAVNRTYVNGTPGPLFNEVVGMMGAPQIVTDKGERHANNRFLLAMTQEKAPTAIAAFYGVP